VPDYIGSSSKYKAVLGHALPRKTKEFYGVSMDVQSATMPAKIASRNVPSKFKTLKMQSGDVAVLGDVKTVFMSSAYKDVNAVTARKAVINERYKARKGKDWFYNATGETVPLHEMGHVYYNRKRIASEWEPLGKRWASDTGIGSLATPSESFAEAFADLYHTGGERLPAYVHKFFKDKVK
jgi:hypothetical protein